MPAIQPCSPALLPIKRLDWKRIAPYLGDARDALARLDVELKDLPQLIDLFLWSEALASLQSQKIRLDLKKVWLYAFASIANEKDKASLQKILYTKQALDEALSLSGKMPLDKRFFCRTQKILKQDCLRKEDVGHFRKRQNWIGVRGCKIEEAYFYPPKPSRLDPLFRNLEKYLESQELDPLVQAAIGFAQFLIIHPFMDGNGRTARIFIPVFAMKKGIVSSPAPMLSAYFEIYRNDYFQKLYQLTEKGDWADWIIFFLKGVISQSIHEKCQAASLKKVFQKIERLAGPFWAEKVFRSPICKCKKSKTVDLLVRKKILIALKEGLYFASPLFRAMK